MLSLLRERDGERARRAGKMKGKERELGDKGHVLNTKWKTRSYPSEGRSSGCWVVCCKPLAFLWTFEYILQAAHYGFPGAWKNACM